ncbi:cytochrome P450 [Neolentinus lepideus HHB14362 ss-1]|uniref:Cytochrome P450 n=1 Tax=Neolentinus lepideus HHB14362 ss-1 TaxID=1314782 RepID=A0A165NGC3_9AGAM|nr:cytochrome P450 [Neolentinus lepideus HHB14362 ss-1]
MASLDASRIVILCVVLYGAFLLRWLSKRTRLPPGPFPFPLLGNLPHLPRSQEWTTYADWGKQYGDVIRVCTLFGRSFYVLNSRKSITDLLDARSHIYSDRPHLVMANDIMGWGDTVVMSHYGQRFRNYRKILKNGLGQGAIRTYVPLLEDEAVSYLESLVETPKSFVQHFRRTSGAIALKIAYGYDITSDGDTLLHITEQALNMFSIAALPGMWLVDTIPFLKYAPDWLPFAEFKRQGKRTRQLIVDMIAIPFEGVKRQLKDGTAKPSFTAELLEANRSNKGVNSEDDIKWVATGLYTGQADTTVAAMETFFLAMMLHPDVQVKAQAEVDRVTSRQRLPKLDDRESLPYVESVVREVLRWHPVVTMVAHAVTQDDTYRTYHVPKGTTLVANIWAALHDEDVYSKPEEFRPERFLPPENAPNPDSFVFGFGRRSCPGILVAHATIFLLVASTLAAFTISKETDAKGAPLEPELIYCSGVVSRPKAFECKVKPRFTTTEELISQAAETRNW